MCCNGCFSDICLVILSVLFPPLPVWIRRGFCSCDSLINICLFLLGYFPGLIHSWYIIAKYPPYSDIYYIYRSDLEHQTPRHIVIHCEHESTNRQPTPPQPFNYGAIDDINGNFQQRQHQNQAYTQNQPNGQNTPQDPLLGNSSSNDQNNSNPPPYSEFTTKS